MHVCLRQSNRPLAISFSAMLYVCVDPTVEDISMSYSRLLHQYQSFMLFLYLALNHSDVSVHQLLKETCVSLVMVWRASPDTTKMKTSVQTVIALVSALAFTVTKELDSVRAESLLIIDLQADNV